MTSSPLNDFVLMGQQTPLIEGLKPSMGSRYEYRAARPIMATIAASRLYNTLPFKL